MDGLRIDRLELCRTRHGSERESAEIEEEALAGD
jgi:hypothetical protein